MGIPQRYACLYQCYTWPIVKNNLFDDDQWGITLYLDTVHSVLLARTARGQLFRRHFADIVTEFFKYSLWTTTKSSMFLDKHSINKPVQKISGKYLYSLYFFFTAENPRNTHCWHLRERFSENPLALKVLRFYFHLIPQSSLNIFAQCDVVKKKPPILGNGLSQIVNIAQEPRAIKEW
jgi:hypothetical protein